MPRLSRQSTSLTQAWRRCVVVDSLSDATGYQRTATGSNLYMLPKQCSVRSGYWGKSVFSAALLSRPLASCSSPLPSIHRCLSLSSCCSRLSRLPSGSPCRLSSWSSRKSEPRCSRATLYQRPLALITHLQLTPPLSLLRCYFTPRCRIPWRSCWICLLTVSFTTLRLST